MLKGKPVAPMAKGEGDHVGISPERDTPAQGQARKPGPGSETSWRDTPQSAVTSLMLTAALLLLLFFLGLLLGAGWASWTTRAVRPRLHQQTKERRRLNAEWAAVVRTARRQGGKCPRCTSPLRAEQELDATGKRTLTYS